jgi:transposase InsO family protein
MVELIMRRLGLVGLPGRPRYRKIPNMPTAEDLVNRDFARTEPNRLWLTDITEHPTREGEAYCAVVLDAFSRSVVGWSIDSSQTSNPVVCEKNGGVSGSGLTLATTGRCVPLR